MRRAFHKGGVDNINSSEGGTSATYALRRLKRDHPELAEKVVSGKLSAHAAAIEAGFRKRTIAVPADNPDSAVAVLIRKFGAPAVMAALYQAVSVDGVIYAVSMTQYQKLFHERIVEYRRRLQPSEEDGA